MDALVLTLDPAYFRLTGGIERWLYRLGAQTRRQAGEGLAFRPAPLAPEVRQPAALRRLRGSASPTGARADVAGLRTRH